MKRWSTCAAVLILIGCGADQSSNGETTEADVGATDVGVTDVPPPPDVSGGDDGDDSDDDLGTSNNSATPRDDLEVVVEDREVDFADGSSGRLAFDVPENATSVTVSVTGAPGEFFTLEEWKNGDGSDVVPSGWIDSDQLAPTFCLSCPNRIASSEASFAALLPNNESVELVSGTHNISAYAYKQAGFSITPISDATATVRVVVKVAPDDPTEGGLDVNFHFTGANGWTAETAPEDADFQKAIEELQGVYDQLGIEIGDITYTDISEDFQVIESIDAPGSDLQEMFALSVEQPRAALNVFVVEELLSSFGRGFGVIAGVSGGIPGPPMAGTHRSGVAVATKENPEAPVEFYRVLAHEMGHHLGLYHTTENALAGGIHDPIDDTPEDDPTLLMFTAPEGDTVTTTQGEVIRGNAWIYHGGTQ